MKFFANVIQEMKKVTWPTSKEVARFTTTVIVTVLLAVIFFSVVDFGITSLLDFILR